MRYLRPPARKSCHSSVEKVTGTHTVLVIVSICFCLMFFGPYFRGGRDSHTVPGFAHAAETDTQFGDTGSATATDDTPNEEDIADFAAEFDKDGDGEIDEPEEDDDEDVGAEDEADQEDDASDQDDSDDQEGSDDQDRDNREDEYLYDEELLDDESEDLAHSGKNRDDIDGEASPDYRLSGYERYIPEGSIRRLGGLDELTPLIEREERMILEN